jgi:hypothetical protein
MTAGNRHIRSRQKPASSILKGLRHYRRRRHEARIIRKLKQLRSATSPAGYTLKSFDEHQCIFVHIPKCAGVSVSKSLFGNLGAGHHGIATYQQIFSESEFNEYFKFTFTRNPWDRLVSAYLFLKQGGFNDKDRQWANRNLAPFKDFESFVRQWVNRENIHLWPHFRPQYEYLLTQDGVPAIDFVGRYENLEKDFIHVRERLGINSALLELNRSQNKTEDYRLHYCSETTKQIVADTYKEDIDFFKYDF